MGRLEFIEKLVGHIAWPAATIAVLLIIRGHLAGIFAALKSLKLPGGVELELYDRFKELREQAEAAKLPVPPSPTLIDDEHGKFLRLAEDFPAAAIMETWIRLEKEIRVRGRFLCSAERRVDIESTQTLAGSLAGFA